MAETNFFGLQKVGAGEPLSLNDYAFTTKNLDRIDQIMYRMQNHQHNGDGPPVDDPVTPLSISASLTGGNIPAGVTVRYKYTLVDEFGSQTAASQEATYTTPEPIAIPGSPNVQRTSTGGALLPGNYFYALSAYVGANTTETPVGDRGYTTVPVGTVTNLITLTLPTKPVGAAGFNVYRRAPGESTYSYLASINMSGPTPPTTYVDNGSVAENCNRHPQNNNLTNSSNSVVLTLPGATPEVPEGFTWKVYRTYAIGNYANSLLAWVVEETTEGSGIISPTFTDIGQASQPGNPPTVTELVTMPSPIDLATETQGMLNPGRVLQALEVTFAFPGPLTVQEGTFSWRSNWYRAKVRNVTATLGRDSAPVATPVIVDVNKCESNTSTWTTIFDAPGDRVTIPVGERVGLSTVTDVYLDQGDELSVDVDQIGGGATPTDSDLLITVNLYVQTDTPDTEIEFT